MNTVTKHIVTAKAIIAREKELCQHIDAAIEEWSKQAQQTQQYMKALEYVKTPPTPHTSNRWTVSEYGNHEMSNMVYRFSWREYEHTEWDTAVLYWALLHS